ncbi:lipopolysaccharide transport periplasmic protein LptA [Uliginosibacterium sp. sgz301328]|uniref:lipopolysaccharide transport periplasmic protein LptA n=1 Tax=Uliginosibacterium sp. sgz301328 TaxID=3243764 RepID=UPI00359EC4B4
MKLPVLTVVALLLAQPVAALAERADREKPVNIEADKLTVDDRNKVQTFEGRVKLTQGTLVITADKVVVTQDADGFQKGVATGGAGGLSRFRQKREGRDEYIEGEAERIDYDGKTDRAQLFRRSYVKSGRDEVRGQYIEYDGVTENYLVTNGPNATVQQGVPERVRAVIQPKNAASAPVASPTPATPGSPATSTGK